MVEASLALISAPFPGSLAIRCCQSTHSGFNQPENWKASEPMRRQVTSEGEARSSKAVIEEDCAYPCVIDIISAGHRLLSKC